MLRPMLPAGFLGTSADLLTDGALMVFIVLPLVMPFGFRLARRNELGRHRTVQVAFLLVMTLAVVTLEVDIRLQGGSGALAGRVVGVPSAAVRGFLAVHLAIAVTTWIAWVTLVVRSWRRFRRTLPGDFSAGHRKWGRRVWLGVAATAATGTVLYVLAYAL
jgi:putative membrane protein